jgi:hypothetical protein
MPESNVYRNSADSGQDEAIRANNFGGANTEANPLNMPYTDSPVLVNCDITEGQTVKKRRGTDLIQTVTGARVEQYTVPVTTPSGRAYLISKKGTELIIEEVVGSSVLSRLSMVSVWKVGTENAQMDSCVIPESDQRVVFVTARHTPIQVRVAETTLVATVASNSFTVPDQGARLLGGLPINTIVYVNGVVRTTTAVASGTGNLGVTISGAALAVNDTILVVNFMWQWWSEATTFFGNRMYQAAFRGGAQNLEVPTALRDGLKQRPNNTYDVFPYREKLGGATQGFYSFTGYPVPAGVYNYNYQENVVLPGATLPSNDQVSPTGNNIYFGSPLTTGEQTHWLRIRDIEFRNGQAVNADSVKALYGSPNANNFGYRNALRKDTVPATPGTQKYQFSLYVQDIPSFPSGNITTVAAGVNTARHIMFIGGTEKGIATDQQVLWYHTDTSWVGIAAATVVKNDTASIFGFNGNAAPFPVYGFGTWADTYNGYFPSTICVFQGRLVLGGFPNNSLKLVFSSLQDSRVPSSYNDFQLDPLFSGTGGAFDYDLGSSGTDIVTAVRDYQGSIIVFTQQQCRRVVGSNSGLSFLNVSDQLIASYGAANPQAVRVAGSRLFCVSYDGAYELVQASGLSDAYQLQELSVKVRTIFTSFTQQDMKSSKIYFDDLNRKLYVRLPADRMLVMDTRLGWWSEYRMFTGLFSIIEAFSVPQVASSTRSNFFIRTWESTNTYYLLRTESIKYLDFYQQNLSNVFTAVASAFRGYAITNTTVGSTMNSTVMMSPLTDVNDVLVLTKRGAAAVSQEAFGTGYIKLNEKQIKLTVPLAVGDEIYFLGNAPSGAGLYIYLDNTRTFSYTIVGNTVTVTNPSLLNVSYGLCYEAIYASPVFTSGILAQFKRMKHFNAQFSNHESALYNGNVYLTLLNYNTTFVMNNSSAGTLTTDNYGSFQNNSLEDYTVFREPIQGVGYSFQCYIWSFDDTMFELVGYQIDGATAGKRYANRRS